MKIAVKFDIDPQPGDILLNNSKDMFEVDSERFLIPIPDDRNKNMLISYSDFKEGAEFIKLGTDVKFIII